MPKARACADLRRSYFAGRRTTTVQAIYDEGVLKLRRRRLPPPLGEVLVTVEMAPDSSASDQAGPTPVAWPDISARLRALYGEKTLAENAVIAARSEERY